MRMQSGREIYRNPNTVDPKQSDGKIKMFIKPKYYDSERHQTPNVGQKVQKSFQTCFFFVFLEGLALHVHRNVKTEKQAISKMFVAKREKSGVEFILFENSLLIVDAVVVVVFWHLHTYDGTHILSIYVF